MRVWESGLSLQEQRKIGPLSSVICFAQNMNVKNQQESCTMCSVANFCVTFWAHVARTPTSKRSPLPWDWPITKHHQNIDVEVDVDVSFLSSVPSSLRHLL